MPRKMKVMLAACMIVVLLIGSQSAIAAPSVVDGFAPSLTSGVSDFVVQPDGKTIIYGGHYSPSNINQITRLNVDGTTDTTFYAGTGVGYGQIHALALQADGKLLVGGLFFDFNGTMRRDLARVNANGSLDTSFNPSPNDSIQAICVQPDGRILVSGDFTTIAGAPRNRIARLNADGTIDPTFNPGSGADGLIRSLCLLPDGKILAGGSFTHFNGSTRYGVVRLDSNGSLDPNFTASFSSVQIVSEILVQPDAKILICNGKPQRLNSDGSLDTSFATPPYSTADVYTMALQPDGKVLFGGTRATSTGKTFNRLNADGSLDTTFNTGTTGSSEYVHKMAVLPNGQIQIAGTFTKIGGVTQKYMARLSQSGVLDVTFDPGALYSDIRSFATDDSGRVVIGGLFTQINGTYHNRIARLNPNGSLDTTFDPGTGADSWVNSVALQADGKVVIAGNFTTINGTSRNRVARLNADGSLDTTFNPGTGADQEIRALTIQADGKVLITGYFTTFNGTGIRRVARLNTDGSLDTTFNREIGPNSLVDAIAVQSDGKILIGGLFTQVNTVDRYSIARLFADGSLDTSYNPILQYQDHVFAIVIQPDGKAIIGGSFTTVNGISRSKIARLNTNGSLDTTFDPGSGFETAVQCLGLQADGKVLAGGRFLSVNGSGSGGVARLNHDGSVDASYLMGAGTNDTVYDVEAQTDGKVMIAGYFTTINYTTRHYIARLTATDMPSQQLTVWPNGTTAEWRVGGGYPQPNRVSFEYSADGTTWNPLGSGIYIPGDPGNYLPGYYLNNLSMPKNTYLYVRVTGWTASGSIVRSVVGFYNTNYYYIEYAANPHGSLLGELSQSVVLGGSGTAVTAMPDPGYFFATWSDGTADNPRVDTNISDNLVVWALFQSLAEIWVGFDYLGIETGADNHPFNTVAEGANTVASGGRLTIFGGSTPTPIRITKPMTITAYNGVATIGK